jgi:hydroxypyruvate isomerase
MTPPLAGVRRGLPAGMKLCAHLGYQFGEFAPLDRFAEAAKAGFHAVEWPAVYDWPAEQLGAEMRRQGLSMAQVTLPTGDAVRGEKGLAALPGREAEFARGLQLAIAYAHELGANWIHPMAGVVPEWTAAHRETYIANLGLALREAGDHGKRVLVEVIDPREVPGYAMGSYERAAEMFDAVARHGEPRLLLDAYHGQLLSGDLPALTRQWAGRIGHVQIADVPGRHEPGTGSLDFDAFFEALDHGRYSGWIGCEYKPRTSTLAGLGHLASYLGA